MENMKGARKVNSGGQMRQKERENGKSVSERRKRREGNRFRDPKPQMRISRTLPKGGNPAERLPLFSWFPPTSHTRIQGHPPYPRPDTVILKLPALLGQKQPSPECIPPWQSPLCAVPAFVFVFLV